MHRVCIIVPESLTPNYHGALPHSSGILVDPCADALTELVTINSPPCSTSTNTPSYQQLQEQSAKKQQDILRAINTNLFGVFCCVFSPRFDTSIYQQEDQDYHYPVIPDYEGKLLIEGLQNVLRYSGEDQWSSPTITLYWSNPNIFEIQENAKIVAHQGDQKVSLRVLNRRRMLGQFLELYEAMELVPYN